MTPEPTGRGREKASGSCGIPNGSLRHEGGTCTPPSGRQADQGLARSAKLAGEPIEI
jgi:hypothetical protein